MLLADVMRLKSSITVSGSHGKTTTTSLISSILESSNYDPTIINGGIINGLNLNAKLGKGEWLVVKRMNPMGLLCIFHQPLEL